MFLDVGTPPTAWVTIAIGSAVGLAWRRFAASRQGGGIGVILLGITGAFAARWLLDVLLQLGVDSMPYSIIFVVCGAGVLPWCFYGFGSITNQTRKSHPPSLARQSSQSTGEQSDSSETPARAA